MLFRKPVEGDFIQYNGVNGGISRVLHDWDKTYFEMYKDQYTFVSVTVIEPPPPPKAAYINVYQKDNGRITASAGTPYASAGGADRGAELTTRVARINLAKLVGVFDD